MMSRSRPAPAWCPLIRGRPRPLAHLRLPSMTIATCAGTASSPEGRSATARGWNPAFPSSKEIGLRVHGPCLRQACLGRGGGLHDPFNAEMRQMTWFMGGCRIGTGWRRSRPVGGLQPRIFQDMEIRIVEYPVFLINQNVAPDNRKEFERTADFLRLFWQAAIWTDLRGWAGTLLTFAQKCVRIVPSPAYSAPATQGSPDRHRECAPVGAGMSAPAIESKKETTNE